jgi:hypothetical protein
VEHDWRDGAYLAGVPRGYRARGTRDRLSWLPPPLSADRRS